MQNIVFLHPFLLRDLLTQLHAKGVVELDSHGTNRIHRLLLPTPLYLLTAFGIRNQWNQYPLVCRCLSVHIVMPFTGSRNGSSSPLYLLRFLPIAVTMEKWLLTLYRIPLSGFGNSSRAHPPKRGNSGSTYINTILL
jgi:hypothetical protein